MSRTNKKKGSKAKQFKGDPSHYITYTYRYDGVKKAKKHIMKRRLRNKNKKTAYIEYDENDCLIIKQKRKEK